MTKKTATKSSAKKSAVKKNSKPAVKKTSAAKKSSAKVLSKSKVKEKKLIKKETINREKKSMLKKSTAAKAKGKVTTKKTATAKSKTASASKQKIESPKKKVVKGYSKRELEHFKKIILEKRDEILDQLQNLRDQIMDPTTGEYINENSPYSLHMAEQGTDAMEREKTFLFSQRENKFLGYLEDALKRIEAGTYGICIECADEPKNLCDTCPLIPKARLEAVPHSQLCVQMKMQQEKKR